MALVVIELTFAPTAIPFDLLLFVLLAAGVGLFFAARQPHRYSLTLILLIIAFLLTKTLLSGAPRQIEAFYFMATQVGSIALTGLIAHQVGVRLQSFEAVINAVALSSATPLPASFTDAQAVMYREIQRARHHERPLSVVMLQVDKGAMQSAIPTISAEVQQAMMARYILSKVAQILDEELPNFDPVALRDNCFIAVLPEATAADAAETVQRLRSVIEAQTGLQMQCGTATLLDEAMTFEELIESARAKLTPSSVRSNGQTAPANLEEQATLITEATFKRPVRS
jgi:GGDEF domain-containing protein